MHNRVRPSLLQFPALSLGYTVAPTWVDEASLLKTLMSIRQLYRFISSVCPSSNTLVASTVLLPIKQGNPEQAVGVPQAPSALNFTDPPTILMGEFGPAFPLPNNQKMAATAPASPSPLTKPTAVSRRFMNRPFNAPPSFVSRAGRPIHLAGFHNLRWPKTPNYAPTQKGCPELCMLAPYFSESFQA